MNFREQIWCVVSEEMSFETFTPIWSHVNKNEKKLAKIQNLKFHNSLSNFGRYGSGDLEIWWIGTCPQNLALIHSVVSEKTMSTNGRRTDDGRPRDDSSSAVQ